MKELIHETINTFVGTGIDDPYICIVMSSCPERDLQVRFSIITLSECYNLCILLMAAYLTERFPILYQTLLTS